MIIPDSLILKNRSEIAEELGERWFRVETGEDSQSWTEEVPSSSGWLMSDEHYDDGDERDGDDDGGDGGVGRLFNQSC